MKFICTKELGKLARWLRILGHDTLYYREESVGTLIVCALREDRIIVTRRKKELDDLKKKTVVIESNELKQQLKEIISKLNLEVDESKMFTRCTLCNESLKEVRKEDIKEIAPEYVYKTHDYFLQCPICERLYWQGTHWGNVKEVIGKIVGEGL
jgi:uncharacterized protein with PIN domain